MLEIMYEEFLYIKHQPYVRLTLIDNKTKIIIKDIIIPRKLFNRKYIKSFLEDATKGLNYHTIVTDGDKRYKKILEELGLKQQRCIFHSMQNLMAKVNPVHNRLERRIVRQDRTSFSVICSVRKEFSIPAVMGFPPLKL